MDITIILWIAGGIFVVLGWFSSRTINKNERDVENIKREVQNIKIDYLQKAEFKDFKAELHSMFKDLKEDIKALGHRPIE